MMIMPCPTAFENRLVRIRKIMKVNIIQSCIYKYTMILERTKKILITIGYLSLFRDLFVMWPRIFVFYTIFDVGTCIGILHQILNFGIIFNICFVHTSYYFVQDIPCSQPFSLLWPLQLSSLARCLPYSDHGSKILTAREKSTGFHYT